MTFNKIMSILEQYDDEEEILVSDEYWFDEYGSTMYANGDDGDMSHEMHVDQVVVGTILGYFNLEIGDFGSFDLDDYYDDIQEFLTDRIDEKDDDAWEKFEQQFEANPRQVIEDYIVENFNEDREKISKMLNIRDARAYAIEEWGWSRVHGNSIEVNRLTQKQLKLVSRGIWNALDEEGKIHTEEERLIAGQSEYHISTYTGKSYTIKLDDMDSPENIANLEETPVQHEPGFANIDKMDRANMNDFYKDKPFGDSVSFKDFFYQMYTEDALDTLDVQGDWNDGKSHGYDKPSLKMMQNPATVERIKKKWSKLPYDIDMYIVKGPKIHNYTELGRVSYDFVRDKLNLKIDVDDDKITVIYTNNKGSEKVPLTPWTLAHRLGHAMARDNISRDSLNMYTEINKTINKLLLEVAKFYGRNSLTKEVRSGYSYNKIPDEKLKKALVYGLATFKSARDRKLRASFEFTNELIAQYVITGKVTLNKELPKMLPLSYAWGKPQGLHLRFDSGRTEEDLTDIIEIAEQELYNDIEGLFGASIGNIYVM